MSYRKMMECGTTAQMVRLMDNGDDTGFKDLTLKELIEKYEGVTRILESVLQDEDTTSIDFDHQSLVKAAAETCNVLYGIMWNCERQMRIADSKRRKEYAKEIASEMVGD